MAIIKELYITRADGVKLYRSYSDAKKMIRQIETGIEYEEAIDVESATYTYEETDISISEDEENSELELKAQAYDILIGEAE